MTTGIICTPELLFALSRSQNHNVAINIMLNESFPSYGYMLQKGATSIWERWDSDLWKNINYMNDFCHRDLCSFTDWIWQQVVGIQADPKNPGFKHIILRPIISNLLPSIDAQYNSIYGMIHVAYDLNNNGDCHISVTIPANTSATVYLPFEISVDDLEDTDQIDDRMSLPVEYQMPEGLTIINIESGTHKFSGRIKRRKG